MGGEMVKHISAAPLISLATKRGRSNEAES